MEFRPEPLIEIIYNPYRMFYEVVQKKDNFPSGTKKDPMLLLITLNRCFALHQSTVVVKEQLGNTGNEKRKKDQVKGCKMEYHIQQLINGISAGSIYALIALGYTMVYGIIKLINFAHGDVFMVGGFIGLNTVNILSKFLSPLPLFLAALLVSMVLSAVLGVVIERLAYRPLRGASRIAVLITAVGMSFLLEYSMMAIVGPQAQGFPGILHKKIYQIYGNIQIDSNQILVLISTFVLLLPLPSSDRLPD